ncbi:hypothetical protein AB4341_13115 [Vibrio breoganii]
MLKLLGNTFKIRARRFIPATAELITGFSRPKSYKKKPHTAKLVGQILKRSNPATNTFPNTILALAKSVNPILLHRRPDGVLELNVQC